MHKLLLTLIFLIHTILTATAALTAEEVACNKALNDNKPALAAERAIALIKKDASNANAYICQGRAQFALEMPEEALASFALAEEKSTVIYHKAFAALLSGHLYKELNTLPKALKSYQRSLNYANEINQQALQLSNYMNIGRVYLAQNAYQDALSAFESAYAHAGNDNERGDAAANVAAAEFQLNNAERAIEYQVKAVLMFEKSGTLDQYAEGSVNLIQYQLTNNDFSNAATSAKRLLKVAKENGGVYYEAKANLLLAKAKTGLTETESVPTLLNEALNLANKSQDEALIKEIEVYVKKQ